MNWLWIGGGAALVAAVIAVLYFAGLGSVVKIVGAVIGVLADAAGWLRQWLRKPGNKTRFVCLVLAVLATTMGLQSWQRGTIIVQQRADYVALEKEAKSAQQALQEKIDARDLTIAQVRALSRRQLQLLARAKLENAEALAEAADAKRRAAESEAKYQEAFEGRPPECKDAIAVMAAACPTLDGY